MADVSAVKEITDKLENGMKDLFESDKYAAYLRTMSRFHRYSTRNTLLIHLQMPTATRCAGYNDWKNKFKRQVKKGEHGIRIFAPVPFVVKEELAKLDPVTKQPIIGENGQPVMEEYIKMQSARFKIVPVFDVSQTEGEPLPELVESLTGDVARYELFMDALRNLSPLPIAFEDLPSDTDGICHFGDRISIRNGMSEIQTVSAVIHELTHAKLHDLQVVKENGDEPKDRRTEEIEAESVSYAVCQYYGIETGANSFGYLAEWSKTRELKELNASLDTIRKTAAELLDGIDERYRALAKERGIDLSAPVSAAEQVTLNLNPESPTIGQEIPSVTEYTPEDELTSAEQNAAAPEPHPILADYARATHGLLIGANVNLIPVFMDGNFNRENKRIRVKVEEPIGKYQLFSHEEHGDKVLYFMTASGRIDRASQYFRDEWNEETHKWENYRPSELELDDVIPKIAARFESDLSDPTAWAMYQHAAVVNRLDECEAHNIPVRKLRENERKQREAESEREYQEKKRQKQEKYDASVDEIAGAIRSGKTISVSYDEDKFDGKNPVLDLFKLYGINLPLRTQGWVNTGLAEITDGSYRYYKSKHKGDSTAFGVYLKKLRDAINLTPIEQIRAGNTNPDNTAKGAKKTVENNLYEAFEAMFPQAINGEYSYMRLESNGFEPLSIEWIGNDRISVMHTYTMNGDLMYDPMMTFDVDSEARTMTAFEYQMSMPPLYQRVDKDGGGQSIDGNGREQHLKNLRMSLDGFASEWFDNIAQQGFLPVRANMEIDGEETQITFDKDGKPILPEPLKVVADTLEHKLYAKLTDMFPQFMSGEYSTLRLEAENAKPLTLEWVFGDWISISHTYERGGEPAYEPMVMLAVNSAEKTITARSLDLSEPPRHDVVYRNDDPPDLAMQQNINNFTSQWLDRAEKQGFKPVEATIEIDGEDVRVTFDEDGNAVMPKADAISAPENKPRNLPGYSDEGEFIRQFAVLNKYVTDVSAILKRTDVTFTFTEGYTDYLTFFVIPNEADAVMCKDALNKLGVENLFGLSERELKPLAEAAYRQKTADDYELGFGYLGNGITVWNRKEERNGDYKTVAHIETDRSVTFYDKDMPHEVKQRIDAVAKSPETKGFGFSPAPENVPPHIDGAPAPASVYEAVKKVMPETATPKVNEIDLSQPDPSIGLSEMNLYGYAGQEMLPLLQGRAVELFDTDHAIYLLYTDDTEAMALDRDEILNHDGLCGIERADWEKSPVYAAQMAIAANVGGKREADLLYGDGNRFGIYQIKDGIEAARDFRFAPMRELEAHGLSVDSANYELVYTAPFSERIEFLSDRYPVLNRLYEQFNVNQPVDFTGRSLSVSDVVVLKYNGDTSSHFVDSAGFIEIDGFLAEESHREAAKREAEHTDPTYSQVGDNSDAPTVAELENKVKSGDSISLSDLSRAVNAERRTPLSKGKPSLLGKLEQNKQRAAQQGQPETRKNDGLEV
jgi:hypothetical protein